MTRCDTCGCPVEDGHPFRVCAKCLFAEALDTEAQPEPGGPQAPASSCGLAVRRDFFQKYDLVKRIGGGGQGDIWEVWDLEFHRSVAMKRLAASAAAAEPAVYRFLAEAQIASQLEHPGILPIFDVGLDLDGRPFYTTSLLPGTTLEKIWRQVHSQGVPEWTISRALELLVRVCEIMAYAHGRGVIHRDLKPANVLVGTFGDVRVIDWGSAHVTSAAQKEFAEPFVPLNRQIIETARGEAMWASTDSPLATLNAGHPVTLLFAPPEIVLGGKEPPVPGTDIYAMGVMLYSLLANRLTYCDGDSMAPDRVRLEELVRSGGPRPVRGFNRGISRDLAAVCEKAMASSQKDRYSSMEGLADDLRAVLRFRPVKARRSGPLSKLQKWVRRNTGYALMLGAIGVILSVGFFVARGIRAERDVARQVTALRNAELAMRSGHWREALRYWDEAEAGGYRDPIYLSLQRAEAWTVLSEPGRSGSLLNDVARRSDLGNQRGLVLLRLGEHELFDRDALEQGVKHVRDALSAGLTDADHAFAQGLLADSTPAALDSFRQALRYNPYHHGAHRHSLGLEFLLGQQQELSNHAAVFKILYPDDPSPRFLEAAELALQGKLAESQTQLMLLRNQVNSNTWEQFGLACRTFTEAARLYDINALLGEPTSGKSAIDQVAVNLLGTGFTPLPGNLRTPRLPCLQKGLLEASDGLRSLMIPFLSNPEAAVNQIESASRRHPEALIPVLAGLTLEKRQPREGPKLLPVLRLQARLYQQAADSSSMMPSLGRLAMFLAARAEFELAVRQTNSSLERTNCLANTHRALASKDALPAECRAYLDFATGLQDWDLARDLMVQWERQQPGDPSARRNRIQVELAAGAFGPALKLIDQLLAENAHDSWALSQRKAAFDGLNALLDSSGSSRITKP